MDFQKVNQIIINDEEYTVLKPTVHLVTDYFKEYILKRRNTVETNRIFMDNNGYRHFWKGMEIPSQNLRKTDSSIKEGNITTNIPKVETVTKSSSTISTDKENEDLTTVKNTPRRSKRRTTNFYKPILRQSRAGRVITTSFFCPFFGVITMTLNTGEL
ncbi:hypothetical protein RR46_13269 [Papilio xuthus]|uniref:Uncharacterized protein n=1 Tax=Papilio xuthus TaxID=66420 RepID=A0A194PMZ5_PAPXU|nr:hypothetical protein RR46_13269 [Papilio xuthus]